MCTTWKARSLLERFRLLVHTPLMLPSISLSLFFFLSHTFFLSFVPRFLFSFPPFFFPSLLFFSFPHLFFPYLFFFSFSHFFYLPSFLPYSFYPYLIFFFHISFSYFLPLLFPSPFYFSLHNLKFMMKHIVYKVQQSLCMWGGNKVVATK